MAEGGRHQVNGRPAVEAVRSVGHAASSAGKPPDRCRYAPQPSARCEAPPVVLVSRPIYGTTHPISAGVHRSKGVGRFGSSLVLLPPPCRRRFARTLLPLCLCEGRCPFLHLGQATLLADPGQIFADDCSRWCLFSRHPSPWYQRL